MQQDAASNRTCTVETHLTRNNVASTVHVYVTSRGASSSSCLVPGRPRPSSGDEAKMMAEGNVYQMRVTYDTVPFTEEQLVSTTNPVLQFSNWFQTAKCCEQVTEPNAFALATCEEGRPSCRMLLVKSFDDVGFRFFSNYDSRKGRELEVTPAACMLFYWAPLHRQVRIEGRVEKMSTKESTEYFNSRPVSSRVSTCVSKQSQEIPSRQHIEKQHQQLLSECSEDRPPQKPDYWGGYCLYPTYFEFWQGQTNRLHDRIVYKLVDNQWIVKRLSP